MTVEQAPAPARPKPPPATLRAARGLVFFRLAATPLGPPPLVWRSLVLSRLQEGERPPPWGAEAWGPDGKRWSTSLGGRWLETGTGQKFWEWTS